MSATAVIVVHGVVPQPPYDMQDQCADQIASYLNSSLGVQTWTYDVWQPPNPAALNTWSPMRSVSRVYERLSPNTTAAAPPGECYDVIEAYWSPIDKGKTIAARVISWMLRTIFLPLNTAARYIASAQKKAFDICYVGAALVLAIGLLVVSAWFAALSLAAMSNELTGSTIAPWAALATVLDPSGLGRILNAATIWYCGVGLVGGFLLFQALKAALWLFANRDAQGMDRQQLWSRYYAIATLLVVGIILELYVGIAPTQDRAHPFIIVYFLLSSASFIGLRTLLQSFFVNFFGDVEIYCTRDQNSDFYALREAILTEVTETIGSAISARDNGNRRYERVVILAHSLGSTIAMDALIRLYTLKEQVKGVDPGVEADFATIRAFVTFGTSLEKTRYFFDVQRPSPSEAALQFENDQYGVLFTDDLGILKLPNAVHQGICWTNLWYEQDPVANEIMSYTSFMRPDDSLSSAGSIRNEIKGNAVPGKTILGQIICHNQRGRQTMALTPQRICIHGLYLTDPWFWTTKGQTNECQSVHVGVLDIITATDQPIPHKFFAPKRPRYRTVEPDEAGELRDRY